MRLFFGIHRSPDFMPRRAIDDCTHARMSGPWILGAPATHAFTVVGDDGRPSATWWRFDAVAPCPTHPIGTAQWSPWRVPNVDTALWEVTVPEARHALAKAREQTGRPYDIVKMLLQLSAMTARLPGVPHAGICTELVADQFVMLGQHAQDMVGRLEDLLPERIGRMLHAAEPTGLACRIDVGRLA